MLDDIRNLQDWYPVLPQPGERPAFISGILDMRVAITLPSDITWSTPPLWRSGISIRLTGVTATYASVDVTCSMFNTGTSHMEIPVFIGRYAVPTTDSYIVMDAEYNVSDVNYYLSSDVAVVFQEAPKALFATRKPKSDDTVDTAGATPSEYGSFEDANNVSVRFRNNTLSFTAGAGLGTGAHTANPFLDPVHLHDKYGKGLRSVSGMRDIVQISPSQALDIETVPDMSSGGMRGLTLVIRPSASAEPV